MTNSLVVTTSNLEQLTLSMEVTSTSTLLSFLVREPVSDAEDSIIDLPMVSTATLQKIIDFCEHDTGLHNVEVPCDCHVTEWHMETIFVDANTIDAVIQAADYLDMPCLVKLAQIALSTISGPDSPIDVDAQTPGCRAKVTRRHCSSGKENQPINKRPKII